MAKESSNLVTLIFFQVKDIYLHPDLFSYQNGLLNSAGQLKRKTVEKYFKPQLEDMYSKLEMQAKWKKWREMWKILN